MGSLAAEEVAKEVLGTIGEGRIPNITKIAVRKGYSFKTANAGNVQKTKTFKKVLKPLVEQLEAERQAILERMPEVRSKAKYRDLSDGLDKTTKVIQLLTGKATENIAVAGLSSEEKMKLDLLLNAQRTSTK